MTLEQNLRYFFRPAKVRCTNDYMCAYVNVYNCALLSYRTPAQSACQLCYEDKRRYFPQNPHHHHTVAAIFGKISREITYTKDILEENKSPRKNGNCMSCSGSRNKIVRNATCALMAKKEKKKKHARTRVKSELGRASHVRKKKEQHVRALKLKLEALLTNQPCFQ